MEMHVLMKSSFSDTELFCLYKGYSHKILLKNTTIYLTTPDVPSFNIFHQL